MTYTTIVHRDDLKGFVTNNLSDQLYKVTITPISEDEADNIEFNNLKGCARVWLDIDEVRKERLGL